MAANTTAVRQVERNAIGTARMIPIAAFRSARAADALRRIAKTTATAEPPTPGADVFADYLQPGTRLLHGQYIINGFLNCGGFGITYLARDSLDRTVVIKECFPRALCRRSDTIVRARSRAHHAEFRAVVRLFMQEARNLARLGHPNIVGVHQVFEDNDTAYMAIDFIEGRDLLDRLGEGDRFSPAEIVACLKKLLGAVSYIHERGILHRDISPDNILIDRTGQPILIDFGAAREQAAQPNRLSSALRVVKDGYSPQEFYVAGSVQGPSSDLYALAATVYHLITGEAPPDSQRRLAAIAEQVGDPIVPLAGRFAGYPPGFLEALDKAASVLPRDRISSADEWLAMIEGEPVPEPAGSVAPRAVTAAPVVRDEQPVVPEPAAATAACASVAAFPLVGGGIVAAVVAAFVFVVPMLLPDAPALAPDAAEPGASVEARLVLSGE